MTIATLSRQERRALLADRGTAALLVLFLALCLFALWQGHVHRAALVEGVASFQEEGNARAESWRARLASIESGDTTLEDDRWAGLAMGVYLAVSAPPGPLADLSVGVSDVQPMTATVSQWRSIENLFGIYQFQNPLALAAGPFDFAFVITFLLPLLMIVLAYDVLSEDRERGRLDLLLAQPVAIRDLAFARLGVRFGAVLVLWVGAALVGLAVGEGEGRSVRFAIWLTVAAAYFVFWAALITWVVSLFLRSETTLLALVAVWALSGMIGPAVLTAAAEAAYPAPSRLAFLSDAREAASDAYKSRADIMQGMLLDHPELTVDDYSIPEYIRTSFLVTRTVDAKVEPVLERFDAVLSARRSFLNRLQYASPAVLTLHAFNAAAGTDLERQKRFEREVRAYKKVLGDRVEPDVLADIRLTPEAYDALPRFAFKEASFGAVARTVLGPVFYLGAFAALFGFLARANLGRLQTRMKEPRPSRRGRSRRADPAITH